MAEHSEETLRLSYLPSLGRGMQFYLPAAFCSGFLSRSSRQEVDNAEQRTKKLTMDLFLDMLITLQG